MSFSNSRVWFVTGSSQGMGRALVTTILERNERVAATLRTPSMLADLQLQYPPEQLLVLRLDVTVRDEITAAFKKTEEHFHRLDVVVNNAGWGINGEIEGVPEEAARAEVETLFWGPYNITREAVRCLRDFNPPGHGGRIFNISSIAGYLGHAGIGIYSASKFALEGLTESLTRELPPEWNIKAMVFEPGGVETNARKNTIHFPIHTAYTEDSPSRKFLNILRHAPFTGDPIKAAQVIFDMAAEPEPPLRLPLGSISLKTVKDKARQTLEDADKWASYSRAVNMDCYDPETLESMEGF